MAGPNCWKKVFPFALALTISFFAVSFFQSERGNLPIENVSQENGDNRVEKVSAPLRVISKPRPIYTENARQNQTQGNVTLRVTFSANGEIGSISAVKGLPNGLTESAVEAARNIKFEPAKKDGVPYTVAKQVQYNFSIY